MLNQTIQNWLLQLSEVSRNSVGGHIGFLDVTERLAAGRLVQVHVHDPEHWTRLTDDLDCKIVVRIAKHESFSCIFNFAFPWTFFCFVFSTHFSSVICGDNCSWCYTCIIFQFYHADLYVWFNLKLRIASW